MTVLVSAPTQPPSAGRAPSTTTTFTNSRSTMSRGDDDDNDEEEEEEVLVVEEKFSQEQEGEELQLQLQPKPSREEDEEPLLTDDAYSLLYTAKACSRTALFAWFSITLQGGMLLVTFLDLFDTTPEGNDTNGVTNRLRIPAGATNQVMVAQFLGMILTAMVMAAEGDFVIGITQLIKGYDPNLQKECPHASWFRWLLTGLLQSFFGLLLLIDSFILSMQSSTVIDLSLNLTALHFIQEIDNMSFELGLESGLLGASVQADCEHVQNLKGFSTDLQRRRKKCFRRLLILLMTVSLLVPYFILIGQQFNGYYMCQNLYIQFGDAYTPGMAHYSGLFFSQGNALRDRIGQRNYYQDRTNTYRLAYCEAENCWTISKVDDDDNNNNNNECDDFIYKSGETVTFDVMEAAEERWVINTDFAGVVDADWFKIVCNDCNDDTCSPEFGKCNDNKSFCSCYPGRYGVNCQFKLTKECKYIALDQRTRDGLQSVPGTSSFLDREYLAPTGGPRFYTLPVYLPMNQTDFKTNGQVDSFIIFTGRRWVVYSIPDKNLGDIVAKEGRVSNWTSDGFYKDFARYNENPTSVQALQQLTSELINYFPIFFSSPLNYGEDSYGFDPSSVSWFKATTPYDENNPLIPASADNAQAVSARFLCSDCNGNDDNCFNGGFCFGRDGTCVCETFYSGYRCERVKDCVSAGGCRGGGICDKEKRICDCEQGSFGGLCQLGNNAVPDPLFCNECRVVSRGGGQCNNTFSQSCVCKEGYDGKYCNVSEALSGVIEMSKNEG